MNKYINSYVEFIFEEDEKKASTSKNINPNVAKRIAKRVMKQGAEGVGTVPVAKNKEGKPIIIPKDIQLKKLAKELYQSQYDAATYKYVLADKIAAMKSEGADEDTIDSATEMGADQMTNVQMRADAINAQMIAAAGQNTNLALKADELAQGAIQAALAAAQEFYDKRAQKWYKDTHKNKTDSEKATLKKKDEKE